MHSVCKMSYFTLISVAIVIALGSPEHLAQLLLLLFHLQMSLQSQSHTRALQTMDHACLALTSPFSMLLFPSIHLLHPVMKRALSPRSIPLCFSTRIRTPSLPVPVRVRVRSTVRSAPVASPSVLVKAVLWFRGTFHWSGRRVRFVRRRICRPCEAHWRWQGVQAGRGGRKRGRGGPRLGQRSQKKPQTARP